MVEINRVWLNVDTDTNKITLFSRPRVSIRVDEYIWSLIEEHIVKPHKFMRSEKHKYLLKIAFGRFDSVRHQYYPLSPYNGQLREGVKPDSANGWYQRIAVLVSLDAIHSGLLPQYLEQAKQDGRRYLLEHAERIEGGLL